MKTKSAKKETPKTEEKDHAKEQALAQMASIKEMTTALYEAQACGNEEEIEKAERTIQEDPLSVEVRSGWYSPGSPDNTPEEFRILLCWGGPAVQIVGKLSGHREPEDAEIQYQDWGTPWTRLVGDGVDHSALLKYARCFYFGE